MSYLVSSKDRDGTKRAVSFRDVNAAVEFATGFPGLVRIQDTVSKEHWIFLHGVELRGEEGANALASFEQRGR